MIFQMRELTCKNGMIGGTLERKKKLDLGHFIFGLILSNK